MSINVSSYTIASIIIILSTIYGRIGYGQAIETEFGKNRVQYHDDFKYWSKYETRNFITYWYGKGRNIGQVAAQMAELDHNEIRKIIEHKINDKIEIIVYVDVNDLKQSNLGAEDAFVSKSGETKIVGNKMFVYFDGNHHHLRKKIREGIASVYFSAMMFGANFQEIIQNAVLLEVPEWFAQGIISYAGNTWNIFIEDELRDILHRDKAYRDFENLIEDHPRVAGHALWYYISRNYGNSAISNLLYLTRISRDIENAFEFVLNTPLEQVIKESEKFYFQKYERERDVFNLLKSKNKLPLSNKSYAPVSSISISPDGQKMVYAHNNQGKIKIRLFDFKTQKEKKIFKYGFKNSFQETDYTYPLLTWNDKGTEFTFMYLSRDEVYLTRYNIETGETQEQLLPEIFQRVYAIDYYDDRHYVFAASINGLSDLFLYDTKMRQHFNITNDFYDDLDVKTGIYNGEKGLYFSSNRTNDHILPEDLDTILPVENFDLFFFPLDGIKLGKELEDQTKLLVRITSTPNENERYPLPIEKGKKVLYLNDKHGTINTFVVDQEASSPYAINNHGRNLILHSISDNGNRYAFMLYNNGAYEVYETRNGFIHPTQIFTTELKRKLQSNELENDQNIELPADQYDPGMKFVSRFPDPDNLQEISYDNTKKYLPFLSYPSISIEEQKEAPIFKFNSARVLAAGLRFKLANLTTRLDNDVLFEGLELFEGENPQVNQIPMGILGKATVNDLFEDYSFEGGVRFPTSFNGSEYFIFFDNKKKLIDKRYGLYRRALTENVNSDAIPFTKSKKESIIAMSQWKYPFNIYSSIRATASLRFDRYFFKATNDITLNSPVNRDKRLGLKLEYIFDTSLDYRLNIKHGSRAKIYIEAYNQFDVNVIDGFDFEASKGFTTVVGFDARHYIPILRESVIALRSAGALSFGSKPNVYMLGDVNNTILPSFNNSIPIPDDRNFAFKANANHLRGFNSNVRNGSTFVLWNAELRIPVFRYVMERDKGAAFFRNFHIVGFADAGLAWYGANPYSDKNPLNTVTVTDPISQIEVTYFRDPLVAGYGLGLRTTILGYFVRVDYAWGIETREIQDPKWHFSFGYDF